MKSCLLKFIIHWLLIEPPVHRWLKDQFWSHISKPNTQNYKQVNNTLDIVFFSNLIRAFQEVNKKKLLLIWPVVIDYYSDYNVTKFILYTTIYYILYVLYSKWLYDYWSYTSMIHLFFVQFISICQNWSNHTSEMKVKNTHENSSKKLIK